MSDTLTIRLYNYFRWTRICPNCGHRKKSSHSPGINVQCNDGDCGPLASYKLVLGETLEPRPTDTVTIPLSGCVNE